jgi:hypothetical protein
MQLRFDGLFFAVMMSSFVACAAMMPDQIDKVGDKPRIEVVITPKGPVVCDRSAEGHTRQIKVVVSQHNREYEHVFIVDNEVFGYRYVPHQSVSLTLKAGLGEHHIRYGTYAPNESGGVEEITWQSGRKMFVRCCHSNREDKTLIAGGLQ